MKFVTAFFYGNDIEAEKTWKCFCMCNNSDETIIREKVQHYYDKWTRSEVKTVPYFNMNSKKLVWINSDINDEINVPEILLSVLRRLEESLQNK
jgi:cupin superfamily acireductone dioxygenase involved in methionine salvage